MNDFREWLKEKFPSIYQEDLTNNELYYKFIEMLEKHIKGE